MGTVDTSFVKQFGNNVMLLAQQKGSKLRNSVLLKTGVVGEESYIDQLGKGSAEKRTTRHADTPIHTVDHQRRKIYMYDWERNVLLDKQDELKMLIDPENKYTINASYALGRAIDEEIVDQVFATAYTGKEGGTSTSYDTNMTVAHGSAGLTVAKLREARKNILLNDVDDQEGMFIAVTQTQIDNMLATTEVTSSDYNTVKALVNGEVNTYVGFKFIVVSSSIIDVSSDIRDCIAWAKNGIGLAIAKDIKTRIDERSDKSYATQVYASMGIGSVRVDEDRVAKVECDES